MKTRLLFAALLLAAPVGCGSPPLRGGFPEGFEEQVKTAVEIKAPPNDGTTLLAAIDTEITKRLAEDKDKVLDAAVADFDKLRADSKGSIATTIARPENCKVEVQDFNTANEVDSKTRAKFQGEVTRFLFSIHDVKARIATNPSRIELTLYNKEYSWAPADTERFSQLFRLEVRNYVTKAIYDIAKGQNADPVMPHIEAIE